MLSVLGRSAGLITFGISAEGCDVELNVAIENLGQLFGELRTIL